MKTNVETKKGILIDFSDVKTVLTVPVKTKMKVEIVDIEENYNYKELAKLIDADLIDCVEYDEKFDIIVDDEGLLVCGNPVFEITTPYTTLQLAGKLLFLKRVEKEDGITFAGMSLDEAHELLSKLKIKFIGYTVDAIWETGER